MSAVARVRVLAGPVLSLLARAPRRARIRAGARAAYLELGSAVVVLTTPDTPWLPNAIVLSGPLPAADGMATLAPGRIALPGWTAAWNPRSVAVWDPVMATVKPAQRAELGERGRVLLDALGPAPPEAAALAGPDLVAARSAALDLLGRGPGLTPEGDDVLMGACVALAAAGRRRRAVALLPSRLRARTTALSATLLELAAAGAGAEPLHALLDVRSQRWPAALARLEGLGSSSGRAMAMGAAAAAAATQASGSGSPRSDSGRGPKMRRSSSVMATSLMLASRRRM
ncbi:MAG TPA: DUF2877 domain-containing protein [Solirubrobacteraceae bacterium]